MKASGTTRVKEAKQINSEDWETTHHYAHHEQTCCLSIAVYLRLASCFLQRDGLRLGVTAGL